MSKKNYPKKESVITKKASSPQVDLFEKLESFFKTKPFWVVGVPIILGFFTYLLLFDAKVSIGGDDSGYLMRAHRFIEHGEFPFYQGPVYPMVLGFFMLFFGINLFVLKFLSVLFIVGAIFILYKAFEKHVSPLVLFFALTLVGINSYIGLYASMTYSEAFFVFGLSLFLLFFIRKFIEKESSSFGGKEILNVFLLSLFVFVLSQIRFVGIATLGAAIVFFILYKKYFHAVAAFGFFAAIYAGYHFFKVSLDVPDGMSTQMELLFNVDPYDASKGKETIGGFIGRFFGNSDLYLGKTFLTQIGLRPEFSETNSLLTAIVYLLLLGSAFLFYKNQNKTLVFSFLAFLALMSLTFIVLQTYWDQDRMIVVYYPMLFILLLSGVSLLLNEKNLKLLRLALPVIGFILIIASLSRTLPKLQANTLVVQKNFGGDKYYGFTEDWVNYLKMSEYVGKNLPKETVVGSRKAGMSYVYSNGMTQFGINRVKTENPDELLDLLVENNVSYIIDASLRANPAANTGQTIGTVQRFMYFIRTKYPEAFELVHTIGNSEPAYLYKVNYPERPETDQTTLDESL
jgi:hypothetical protein